VQGLEKRIKGKERDFNPPANPGRRGMRGSENEGKGNPTEERRNLKGGRSQNWEEFNRGNSTRRGEVPGGRAII